MDSRRAQRYVALLNLRGASPLTETRHPSLPIHPAVIEAPPRVCHSAVCGESRMIVAPFRKCPSCGLTQGIHAPGCPTIDDDLFDADAHRDFMRNLGS